MLSKVDAIKLIFNFLKKQKEIQILELDAKILHEKQRHANIKDFQIIKASLMCLGDQFFGVQAVSKEMP